MVKNIITVVAIIGLFLPAHLKPFALLPCIAYCFINITLEYLINNKLLSYEEKSKILPITDGTVLKDNPDFKSNYYYVLVRALMDFIITGLGTLYIAALSLHFYEKLIFVAGALTISLPFVRMASITMFRAMRTKPIYCQKGYVVRRSDVEVRKTPFSMGNNKADIEVEGIHVYVQVGEEELVVFEENIEYGESFEEDDEVIVYSLDGKRLKILQEYENDDIDEDNEETDDASNIEEDEVIENKKERD